MSLALPLRLAVVAAAVALVVWLALAASVQTSPAFADRCQPEELIFPGQPPLLPEEQDPKCAVLDPYYECNPFGSPEALGDFRACYVSGVTQRLTGS
jgi:hypothetical protein